MLLPVNYFYIKVYLKFLLLFLIQFEQSLHLTLPILTLGTLIWSYNKGDSFSKCKFKIHKVHSACNKEMHAVALPASFTFNYFVALAVFKHGALSAPMITLPLLSFENKTNNYYLCRWTVKEILRLSTDPLRFSFILTRSKT